MLLRLAKLVTVLGALCLQVEGNACIAGNGVKQARQRWISETQEVLGQEAWPAGVAQRADLPEATASYEFTDVSIEEINGWLEWAGAPLPLEVQGDVSGWGWLKRSSKGWTDWGDYRIEVGLTSPLLTVGGWPIEAATLRLGYAEGDWYVGNLSGVVLSPEQERVSDVELRSRITTSETVPRVHIAGIANKASLDAALEPLGFGDTLNSWGQGELELTAQVNLDQAARLDAWLLSAEAEVIEIQVVEPGGEDAFAVAAQQLSQLNAVLNVQRGSWNLDAAVSDENASLEQDGESDSAVPRDILIAEASGKTGESWDFQGLEYSVEAESIEVNLARLLGETIGFGGTAQASAALAGTVKRGLKQFDVEIPETDIVISGEVARGCSARLSYSADQNELLPPTLQFAIKSFSEGQARGNVQWRSLDQMAGLPVSGSLGITRLDLAKLTMITAEVEGILSLDLDWGSIAGAVPDERTWKADGDGSIAGLAVSGVALGDFMVSVDKQVGASEILGQVTCDSQAFTGLVHLDLEDTDSYTITQLRIDFEAERFDATVTLDDRVVPCSLTGEGHIAGAAGNLFESGTLHLERLALQIPDTPVVVDGFDANLTPERIQLHDGRLLFGGGEITASGSISRTEREDHRLSLDFDELDMGGLAGALEFSLPSTTAIVSGHVDATVPAVWKDGSPDWNPGAIEQVDAVVELDVNSLSVAGRDVGDANLKGRIQDGGFSTIIDAKVFGGTAYLNAAGPVLILSDGDLPGSGAEVSSPEFSIDGNVNSLELSELFQVAQASQRARTPVDLKGRLTATAALSGPEVSSLNGLVQMRLERLRSNAHSLLPAVVLRGKVEKSRLIVSDATTKFCGGTLRASGFLDFAKGMPQGRLKTEMRSLSLSALTAVAGGDSSDVEGRVSIRSDLRVDRRLTAKGVATITGVTVGKIRCDRMVGDFTVDSTYDGFRELRVDLAGNCLGGRLTGLIDVKGAELTTRVSARLAHGKANQISDALGFPHIAGRALCDAKVELRSSRLSDPDKLSGGFSVELSEGDARSIPVVPELTRFIPFSQLASAEIESGVIDGRFRGRQIQILDCLISSSEFWLMGKGKVSTSGKLDLEVLLQTGGGLEEQIGRVAVDQLIRGVLPQAILLDQINDLLQDRSVFLHIGGTTSHPVLQVRPLQSAARNLVTAIQRQLTLGAQSSFRSDR